MTAAPAEQFNEDTLTLQAGHQQVAFARQNRSMSAPSPTLSGLAVAALLAAFAPGPAAADETVATAQTQDPDAAMAQIRQWIAASEPVELEEPDADGVILRDEAPRQIHGEAGVAVGTGGYRSAYVAGVIPLSRNATLGLAVSETKSDGPGWYPAPYYGAGARRSYAMSLALGDAAAGSGACSPYGHAAAAFGPTPSFGWSDPGAQALARTSCRTALEQDTDWRD